MGPNQGRESMQNGPRSGTQTTRGNRYAIRAIASSRLAFFRAVFSRLREAGDVKNDQILGDAFSHSGNGEQVVVAGIFSGAFHQSCFFPAILVDGKYAFPPISS